MNLKITSSRNPKMYVIIFTFISATAVQEFDSPLKWSSKYNSSNKSSEFASSPELRNSTLRILPVTKCSFWLSESPLARVERRASSSQPTSPLRGRPQNPRFSSELTEHSSFVPLVTAPKSLEKKRTGKLKKQKNKFSKQSKSYFKNLPMISNVVEEVPTLDVGKNESHIF